MSEFNKIHDEEGWNDWGGGIRPVAADAFVAVKLENSKLIEGFAKDFRWIRHGMGNDIVAYRVIYRQKTEQEEPAIETKVGGYHYNGIEKQFALDLIKLLSALESWSFTNNPSMPDYLMDECERLIEGLSKIVLEDAK